MSDAADETAVNLRHEPATVGPKRVLGIVPGMPVAGDRKEPSDDDMVMVWPHLLVRHAVAAMGALLVVMIISVLFDAPLREIANSQVTPNPEKAPWNDAWMNRPMSFIRGWLVFALAFGGFLVYAAA